MTSGKKIFGLVLALVMMASIGCSRNKQAAAPAVPAGMAVAPSAQPYVNETAPAPAPRRSSSYIK